MTAQRSKTVVPAVLQGMLPESLRPETL